MKKNLIALGATLTAIFTLTNCTEEIQTVPQKETTPFTIMANTLGVKTVNAELNTNWADGDKLTVFHAAANSTAYSSNLEFTVSNVADGKFSGSLKEELTESNDWYVLYPYVGHVATPANTSKGYTPVGSAYNAAQVQAGNNSMAHIAGSNYPMWGVAKGVEGKSMPDIKMTHLSSLIEVVVTNKTNEALTVSDISFTAPEYIVGTYYIDFSTDTPVFTASTNSAGTTTYASDIANLRVEDGEAIAANGAAKFYLAIKPFTATAGQTLALAVNGVRKPITLSDDAAFAPGKIKTLNYTYDYVAEKLNGKYAVLLDKGESYLALSCENTGNNQLKAVSYAYNGTDESIYDSEIEPSLVWTLTESSGKYTMLGSNNQYLSYPADATDNRANTSETPYELTILPQGDGTYLIKSVNDAGRKLEQYKEYQYFAFYKTDYNDDFRIVKVVEDAREQLGTPVVTAKAVDGISNAVTVEWGAVANAEKYVVTCGETSKEVTALTVTFEDLGYDSVYTISVVAKSSSYKTSEKGTAPFTTGARPTSGTPGTIVSDVINQNATGSTSTSYKQVLVSATNSGAVYSIKCAGKNGSVQLNADSDKGIVTTQTGGKLRKVSIVWQTTPSNDRGVEIRGSNTAYPTLSAENGSAVGELLGTITATNTTLEITDDYKYVSVKGVGGAVYMTSITIDWEQ